MRNRNAVFSDLTQIVNGAASALGGVREELKNMQQSRTERSLNERGLVTREDFDAVVARIDALAARIAVMESQLAGMQSQASKPKAAKATKTKPKAQK